MISFGHPWVLALLALVPVLWGLWLFGASRGARKLRNISRTPVTGPPIVASFLLALVCFLTETLLATRVLDFHMLQREVENQK